MNDLLDIVFLVIGIFAAMSALLWLLAAIDPQTAATDPTSADALS